MTAHSQPNLIPLTHQTETTTSPVNAATPSLYQQAEGYGTDKVIKAKWESFGLAIFAGAFIALAFVFYITVTTGSSGPWGLIRLAGGLAFSLGLMLVVICGGELFTSTVLSSVAWAQKKVSSTDLLKCWARVYAGNFVGAMLMLCMIVIAGMQNLNDGQWGLNALNIAQHKLHHGWWQAFVLGMLCNMLVCLGVWMTFASKDALTKAILLMLPVAMFVSSGFEHSIANLFMVPLGIVIAQFSDPSWFEALNVTQSQFADLTINHFIINNLIPVTLGNIVGGGLFVGLGYWLIEKADPIANQRTTSSNKQACLAEVIALAAFDTQIETPLAKQAEAESSLIESNSHSHLFPGVKIMPKTIQRLNVSDLMNPTPFTLTADLSVYEGLKQLSDSASRGAPVVNEKKQLLGFISQQDLLRSLWSEEFVRGISFKVGDLMQTQVLTVSPLDAVADLIELMVVDRSKLFPVNDSAMLIGNTFKSYEERLRGANASKPSVFPVVDEGVLCGVITREDIAQKVCDLYKF
ncbi:MULTISPECIES: formate transporter FocA [unclassified Shewanella]|uniref:formate transporter FocA n=1 Tax=unclassified Shewanella TaxID=196818 RepID=UPI000C7D79BC|nr:MULTISPECIES: formate transporter FocA [unclassified Shewanella]PKG56413.1 formate transporter FocA [Shewanella sp. GutDb-MelDb]PKG74183.1 formate transporter FocA [Shewanella sp. GutCb]